MAAVFRKAQRKNISAHVALCGPTGSGKTFTALGLAITLADGGKVAVIDTERSSADRYADRFQFDACQLERYSPESYMEAIEAAAAGGYAVLVIDSLSHAWDGAEGLLERVDSITKRSKSGNSFNAWGEATPLHRRLIDSILAFPGHVIVTMRSKIEYVLETNERGKQIPRKVGMAPVQRQGVEYEFDVVGDMDQEHNLVITKSRAFELADKVVNRPGRKFAQEILAWARGGFDPASTSTSATIVEKKEAKPQQQPAHEPLNPAEPLPAPASSYQDASPPTLAEKIGFSSAGNTAPEPAPQNANPTPSEPPAGSQSRVEAELNTIRTQIRAVFQPKSIAESLGALCRLVGRKVTSTAALTKAEREGLIEFLPVLAECPAEEREALISVYLADAQEVAA